VYEWIYATYSGPSGFIQTEPWDMAIDLWIDSLGALAICFLYDEFRGLKSNYMNSVKGMDHGGIKYAHAYPYPSTSKHILALDIAYHLSYTASSNLHERI
jgi:hypothetical protein